MNGCPRYRRMLRVGVAVRVAVVVAAALLSALPHVAAHHPPSEPEEQLVDAGSRLMLGGFDATQPGPLLIVPHHAGALPCGPPPSTEYRIPLGAAGISFHTNDTHLAAIPHLDAHATGYTAVGLDTGTAVRALIMMQEHAVSLHRHGALRTLAGDNGTTSAARWGMMGVAYELAVPSPHDFAHPMEGEGILIDHDDDPRGATFCTDPETGQHGLVFPHAGPGAALGPGRIVHVVALHDAAIAEWLPRPIDGSTTVLQANLYLARAGEDAATARAALSPQPRVDDLLALAFGTLGILWVLTAPRRAPRQAAPRAVPAPP